MFGRKKHIADESVNVDELSVFDRSLLELTQDDLGEAKNVKKQFSLFDTVRIFLIVVCISVFIYCMWLLLYNEMQYREADDIYSALSNEFFDVTEDSAASISDGVSIMKQTPVSVAVPIFSEALKLDDSEISRFYSEKSDVNMEFERMKSKLDELRSRNDDIVGFIHAEGTRISYPVTVYTDNEYYLDHSFDKKTLKSGTIFMDYRNERELKNNRNIVIYGHNMNNGSMLGDVTKYYKNEDFFDDAEIVLYSFDGIYTFEVFSVYKTTADYRYFKTSFDSDREFIDFADEVKGNSVWEKDVSFGKDDILLTLSTCTNTNKDGRYALHAKLVKIDT